MKWTTRILTYAIGLGLLAAVIVALRQRPIEVETATAIRAPLAQNVVDTGKARIRERYTVSAPVSGTMARIDLHEGDVVEPGTVLARVLPLPSPLLDPRAREVAEGRVAGSLDQRRQAAATLERAQTAAALSHHELDQQAALAAHDAVPAMQYEQAMADARMRDSEVESARFAVRVAEHAIEEARAAVRTFSPGGLEAEQLEITSPVHGQVLHVLQRSAGVVNAGTALIEVGDPAAIELVADVLSQDAVAVRPGMPARALHWASDGVLGAHVRRVEPAAFTRVSALGVEEQRVNVVLDLDGAPEQWRVLGDGFSAEIEITIWSRNDVLQVPTSALFHASGNNGWAAFVVANGHALERRVTIGHRGALQTEILTGLSAGDRVVIHPGASIRSGLAVSTR